MFFRDVKVAVLHEMAKRMKEALDHLMKIHHRALVADRLQHPLVFVSAVVESRVAACICGKNFRPDDDRFKRRRTGWYKILYILMLDTKRTIS